MYAAHARELANASTPTELGQSIADFKRKIKSKVPSKDIFASKFKNLNYLAHRQREIIRYTLWRIDKSRNPALDIDREASSIEHVTPQAEKIGYASHSIGNLLIVPIKFNSENLGAKSFADKKQELINGGYPLDPTLNSAASWGQNEIAARTQELTEYAYDTVWAIR